MSCFASCRDAASPHLQLVGVFLGLSEIELAKVNSFILKHKEPAP